MTERYSKIFTLSENLYATGSPVVIEAGALQKDNKTGSVFAQIKMKNITAQTIKVVKAKLTLFDVAGNILTDGVEQQYLDLKVARDESFGSKTAIKLKEATARSFTVNIVEVVFEDGSMWSGTASPWEILSEPISLINYFNDEELVKQYELKYGSPCHTMLLEEKDLWHCTCGALNKDNEVKCHECGKEFKALKELNLDALNLEKEMRLEAERIAAKKRAEEERKAAELAEQKAEIARAKEKVDKKKMTIIFAVSLIAMAIIISIINVNMCTQMRETLKGKTVSGSYTYYGTGTHDIYEIYFVDENYCNINIHYTDDLYGSYHEKYENVPYEISGGIWGLEFDWDDNIIPNHSATPFEIDKRNGKIIISTTNFNSNKSLIMDEE